MVKRINTGVNERAKRAAFAPIPNRLLLAKGAGGLLAPVSDFAFANKISVLTDAIQPIMSPIQVERKILQPVEKSNS
jgi:hypothetical protein